MNIDFRCYRSSHVGGEHEVIWKRSIVIIGQHNVTAQTVPIYEKFGTCMPIYLDVFDNERVNIQSIPSLPVQGSGRGRHGSSSSWLILRLLLPA